MLAIELYCRTPFGRIHSQNKDILKLAAGLDRTAGSVAMKMVNFAALDRTLPQKGLSGYSKLDEETWSEFFAAPAEFLDRVEAVRSVVHDLPFQPPQFPSDAQLETREGEDVLVVSKRRRNQDFFRRAVLASYKGRCAVTGISQSDLLIASHIVGWAEDENLRVNPSNGICLNALHDRAFDRKLISFEDDGSIIIFPRLVLDDVNRPFFVDKKLSLPERFAPSSEYLSRHRDACLKAA